jgi:hypothetical protein
MGKNLIDSNDPLLSSFQKVDNMYQQAYNKNCTVPVLQIPVHAPDGAGVMCQRTVSYGKQYPHHFYYKNRINDKNCLADSHTNICNT